MGELALFLVQPAGGQGRVGEEGVCADCYESSDCSLLGCQLQTHGLTYDDEEPLPSAVT